MQRRWSSILFAKLFAKRGCKPRLRTELNERHLIVAIGPILLKKGP